MKLRVGPARVAPWQLRVLALSAVLLVPSVVLAADLMAHWKFEEGSGRTVTDSSGNGNTGSFTPNSSSSPRWAAGGIGLALDFDGVADTITVPNSPTLQLPTFTIGLWLKVDKPAIVGLDLARYRQATILRRGWAVGAVNYSLTVNRVTGQFGAYSSFNGANKDIAADGNLFDDQWHHVAYSYDGSTQRIYVDGALRQSVTLGLPVAASPQQLDINLGYPGFGLDAHMDDVRIYRGALTDSEVAQLADSPKPSFAPPAYPPRPPDPVVSLSTRFSKGSRVKTRYLVHVRDTPSTDGNKIGASLPQGVGGKVVAGPVPDRGGGRYSAVQWWQVNFSFGPTGWVPDDLLIDKADPIPIPHAAGQPPLPGLAQWEQNMLEFGQYHCRQAFIAKQGIWDGGSVWFYDGQRAFYRIADYTGVSLFNACAKQIGDLYQKSVFDHNGVDYAYRTFTRGLRMDYERTGDLRAKEAVFYLAKNAVGAADTQSYQGPARLRENSYLLEHLLDSEAVGWPGRPSKVRQTVENSLSTIQQLFVERNYKVKTFMTGLQAESLIQYFEKSGDPRILPALKTAADGLWAHGWVESAGGFPYCTEAPAAGDQDCNPKVHPGLNMLIAHLYGWLYRQTGDVGYREKGDKIFKHGVEGAAKGNPYLPYGKQFTQNYRLSFDYITYRNGGTGGSR